MTGVVQALLPLPDCITNQAVTSERLKLQGTVFKIIFGRLINVRSMLALCALGFLSPCANKFAIVASSFFQTIDSSYCTAMFVNDIQQKFDKKSVNNQAHRGIIRHIKG